MFTKEIDDELKRFLCKLTLPDLTDHINKKFNASFKKDQIKYRKEVLLADNFGKPDQDALGFVELAQKEANEKGGYFAIEKDQSNRLKQAIFISETMLKFSNYFLDIIIIDTTYKRNRFNLPLVNVIGIDNFGHNIMLAFGLLTDEKLESYKWFFKELKSIWNRDPLNVITDDSFELQEGNKIKK